eukprot:SAG31_NODE_1971_length_6758_cov_3.905205_2_plen_153_part_00
MFRVNVVQLEKLDARYGTSLVAMATAAWKGDDTIAGQAVACSAKSTLATKSCYWGRSYPLSVLLPSVLGTEYKDYTIIVYKCPTDYWPKYLAKFSTFTVRTKFSTYSSTCTGTAGTIHFRTAGVDLNLVPGLNLHVVQLYLNLVDADLLNLI